MKYKADERLVAIKISKAGKEDIENSKIELKFLKRIGRKDPKDYNLLDVYDSFTFRNHFFIVTEVLESNLYHYIMRNKSEGMPRELLRNVAE